MDPREYDQALLQAYRARLPKRASDAEFLDESIYSSDPSPGAEDNPTGLMDRLYRERQKAQPMGGVQGQPVPTTKNRFA